MGIRLFILAMLLNGCSPVPGEPEPDAADEFVYLYARLFESRTRESAEAQYLENLTQALADYQSSITVEEIVGAGGEVEFIGIDFRVAAPESEAESLEGLLMGALRLSGAPYETQIYIFSP